jgi:hypothetical protein
MMMKVVASKNVMLKLHQHTMSPGFQRFHFAYNIYIGISIHEADPPKKINILRFPPFNP